MEEHKTILQRELEEVQSQIATLERATASKPDYGLGEGDPGITRWELDQALLEQLRERAETLKRALSGSSQGGYGNCEQCGSPIHPDRLAVLPDTRICINCARASQNP
jgi:DnaK suppressor protein